MRSRSELRTLSYARAVVTLPLLGGFTKNRGSLRAAQAGHFHVHVFSAPSSIARFPLHTSQRGQAGEYAPRPYVSSLALGFNFFLPALRTCLAPILPVTSSLWPSAAGQPCRSWLILYSLRVACCGGQASEKLRATGPRKYNLLVPLSPPRPRATEGPVRRLLAGPSLGTGHFHFRPQALLIALICQLAPLCPDDPEVARLVALLKERMRRWGLPCADGGDGPSRAHHHRTIIEVLRARFEKPKATDNPS